MSVMDRLKRTLSGDEPGNEADTDILDTLKQEHRDVAELLERLVESGSAAERNRC
jgi:hypothetical protein